MTRTDPQRRLRQSVRLSAIARILRSRGANVDNSKAAACALRTMAVMELSRQGVDIDAAADFINGKTSQPSIMVAFWQTIANEQGKP